jgi:molecular chaperone GrpE
MVTRFSRKTWGKRTGIPESYQKEKDVMARKKKRHINKEERRKYYRLRRKAYILNTSIRSEPPLTEESIHVIDNLKQIHEREVKELKDRLLRVHADLDNFRKRSAREKQEYINFANENTIFNLLPVVDNFYHAVKSMEKSDDPAAVMGGVRLIYDQMMRILKESGLNAIEALNKTFDPKYHEAMAISYDKDFPENQVLEVFREGYQMKDRVLRPAMVRVNKKPEEAEEDSDSIKPGPENNPEPLKNQKE